MRLANVCACFSPFRALRYLKEINRAARRVSKQHGIPLSGIVKEQLKLYFANDLKREEYYRYHLFSPQLSWAEKRAFLSDSETRTIQEELNPLIYRYLYKNKLMFKRYFEHAGLPVAKLYGVFDPAWGRTEEGEPLTNARDLGRWIERTDADEIVTKPVESAEGRMVIVYKGRKPGDPNTFISVEGKEYNADAMVRYMTDERELRVAYPSGDPLRTAFLIEQRIHQHPALKEISGETLCGVRICTLYCDDGSVDILGAVFKLQASDSSVDNLHQGSLAVGIAPETGQLLSGRKLTDLWEPYTDTLPDGRKFKGFKLPYWAELQDSAKRAQRAFPYARCIGWDIAVTDNGPCILEGNWGWGADVVQIGNRKGMMTPALYEAMRRTTQAQPVPSPRSVSP